MYKVGIPDQHYRRATLVLGPKQAEHIEFEATKQDDGFYQFSFPNADEYEFKDIVMLLVVPPQAAQPNNLRAVTALGITVPLLLNQVLTSSKLPFAITVSP